MIHNVPWWWTQQSCRQPLGKLCYDHYAHIILSSCDLSVVPPLDCIYHVSFYCTTVCFRIKSFHECRYACLKAQTACVQHVLGAQTMCVQHITSLFEPGLLHRHFQVTSNWIQIYIALSNLHSIMEAAHYADTHAWNYRYSSLVFLLLQCST